MKELLKEIEESVKTRQNGVPCRVYDYTQGRHIETRCIPSKGRGTKSYTIRRIDLLIDRLKELKADLKAGKYDYKG